MISTEDSIIRLVISLILGAIIGYERQSQSKSAGLRTHTLVCVGSCLCMIISINVAMEYFFEFGYRNADPGRIAPGRIGCRLHRCRNDFGQSERTQCPRAYDGGRRLGRIGHRPCRRCRLSGRIDRGNGLIFLVLTVFVRLDARSKDSSGKNISCMSS